MTPRTLAGFIRAHRAELRRIVRGLGHRGPVADSDLEEWISNDESLYLWARREGVDV